MCFYDCLYYYYCTLSEMKRIKMINHMYNCIMSQPDTSLPFALNISRSKDYAPRFNIKTHFSSVEFIIIHITHQYAALFSTEFSLVQMISETVHWQSPYFVICMRIKRTTSCIKYFFYRCHLNGSLWHNIPTMSSAFYIGVIYCGHFMWDAKSGIWQAYYEYLIYWGNREQCFE